MTFSSLTIFTHPLLSFIFKMIVFKIVYLKWTLAKSLPSSFQRVFFMKITEISQEHFLGSLEDCILDSLNKNSVTSFWRSGKFKYINWWSPLGHSKTPKELQPLFFCNWDKCYLNKTNHLIYWYELYIDTLISRCLLLWLRKIICTVRSLDLKSYSLFDYLFPKQLPSLRIRQFSNDSHIRLHKCLPTSCRLRTASKEI